MIGFKLIEGDLRRACTQEPLKKIDFNPHLSPTPLPFHCDTLFERDSSLSSRLAGYRSRNRLLPDSIFYCFLFLLLLLLLLFFKLLIILNYQPIKELWLSAEQEKEDNLLHYFFIFIFVGFYCLDTFVPVEKVLYPFTNIRWLDTVFQGQYLPSLSIIYVAINKVLEKLPPQLY